MSTSNTAFPFASRRFATRSKVLSICALVACATFAGAAPAASFHCTSKASASEKIVCQDPQLSSLDERLAAAYQRATQASLDPRSVESARIEQWRWRQHNCTDKACVLSWYQRRIAELDADYEQAKQAQRDAFETSLTEQKLALTAADAVRQLKSESLLAAAPVTGAASK
ncbi:lysozyme inhibitor LprI family protein [Paraburkholderia phenazinium]|jgi:uncharacterized protein|uniref:Lysozyme inhibitor LprI N-terminal domain-containing protein n=1 Tax=Paraburkholderia phenazinium TaxID=60549 RepID=A0A1G7SGV3_9BURK|nr:hypothetical protein [Paraburkholderia phenazinium]SDG22134.1 hypothetical protein SAMN05216466_102512 [Paraburkholderia phenazinium]